MDTHTTVEHVEFDLALSSDNQATVDAPQAEIARILRQLANRVEGYTGSDLGLLRDSNGNTIGEWHLTVETTDEPPKSTDLPELDAFFR